MTDSRDESGKKVEEVDVVFLVHGDAEGARTAEVSDMEDQGDISIPHPVGVVVGHSLSKDVGEVAQATDGGVGEGRQDGVTPVGTAPVAVVSPVEGPVGI